MRASADRLISALPAVGGVLIVAVFYGVEAHLRKAPWEFTDELEWTQLSRSIAATGHAARRGQAIGFQSLYAYLIAPAWWIHSTTTAYAAIKYLNSLVMCLAAVPTYLLGRLLVARRAAVAVAVLAIAIPAMTYATSIVPESLAYFWFALTAWLAVRALAAPSVRTVVPALAVAAIGTLIRQELVGLLAAYVLSASILWVLAARGRGVRIPWRRALPAVALLAIFGFLADRLVIARFETWQPGKYLNGHTLTEGSLAAGALAIGLGILPAIGGLTSLYLPERRTEPAYRAFAVYLGTATLTFWLYTAGKATFFVGTKYAFIEERNLFYLSPLFLLGTALTLGARKLFWPLVVAATALVLVVVWSRSFQVGTSYFEAPGLSVLALVNRDFEWTIQDFHRLLVGATLVSVALVGTRKRRFVPVLGAALTCAWLLTGEIYMTIGDDTMADKFAASSPSPRNWVDQDTGGAGTAFLVQGNDDPTKVQMFEFWNRSFNRMASLDGSGQGPGPTFVPGLESTDGMLSEYTGDAYTLTTSGVELAAQVVDQRDGFTLYRTPGRWQLLGQELRFTGDGWGLNPFSYAYFRRGGPGVVYVHLGRTGYNGSGKPARVTIRVGKVAINPGGGVTFGRLLEVVHAKLPNGQETTVPVQVASTPVMVTVTVVPEVPLSVDPRGVAAQASFSFEGGKVSAH